MNRWSILAALFVARTAIAFQFQSLAAVSPYLMADLGLDYARLGLLVGIYMLPGAAVSLPGGVLGSRYGDKTVALTGLALMVAGGVLSGAAADYSIVFAGRLIGGIGAVLLNVLLSKMAGDWFAGRELVTAMAILVSSFPLGIGLALVIEPPLAAQMSWQIAFQAAAAFALLGFILVAAFYRPVAQHSASGSAASWGLAFTRDELILVSLAGTIWALLNVCYILLVSFAPTLLIERGLTAVEAGLATSVAGWTLLVSVPLGGLLIERSRRPLVVMTACTLATGVAIALVAVGGASVAMIAVAGFITGLPAGAVMALPAQVLRPAQRSSGMGLYFTWYYLGMALLPPLAGKLRDVVGDPRVPLFMAAALTIVTAACIAGFALKRASASPEAAR